MKKTNNKSKGSDSSYSNNSRNKNEKLVLISENEKYYIDTEIYANNISTINKNKNIISTSKKTKANIGNKIYHSPRPNYNKSIAISPYKSNKKISVQLLSERKEKQKNIRIENNTQKYSVKELNEFTPINLNCISINKPINRIIYKAKKYLIKKGFFCSNKINEYYLKGVKGGAHVEISIYRLKYLDKNNSVYISVKMKNRDVGQEKDFLNKLINYINEDKI